MKDTSLMSLIEIAIEVLRESKEKYTFKEIYDKVAEIKNFTEEEKNEHMPQFYTDITSSGDFLYCGEDLWDLKENQPLDVIDREFFSEHMDIDGEDGEEKKKKPKKAKKRVRKYVEEKEEKEEPEETEDEDYELPVESDDEDEDDETEDNDAEETEDETEDDDAEEKTVYEKDVDVQLDETEDEDEDDDDFDEDKYNSIMDQYEDQY